eukprot:366573-Chlamydomonas_euryale.AAC.41
MESAGTQGRAGLHERMASVPGTVPDVPHTPSHICGGCGTHMLCSKLKRFGLWLASWTVKLLLAGICFVSCVLGPVACTAYSQTSSSVLHQDGIAHSCQRCDVVLGSEFGARARVVQHSFGSGGGCAYAGFGFQGFRVYPFRVDHTVHVVLPPSQSSSKFNVPLLVKPEASCGPSRAVKQSTLRCRGVMQKRCSGMLGTALGASGRSGTACPGAIIAGLNPESWTLSPEFWTLDPEP